MEGELDHHSADTVRKELDHLLEDPTIIHLLLNFKKLQFMDSSGIGVIIGRFKTISQRGGKIGIIEVNNQIQKILEVSGLLKIVNIYDSLQDALDNMLGVK